ncbi:TIGR00341 family protein [Haladaptatus halobius]|uniref:TIGR00341 family protein n=1 Tax=Haladaptatus halobius TaxID=2884875 RepID=UPI001D0A2AA2|nr:TIGR00341 family protein [Haladaptatus halobius]
MEIVEKHSSIQILSKALGARMRLIQLTIPQDKQDIVCRILEQRDLDFTLTAETSGRDYDAVVSIPVETDEVEDLLDAFRSVGIERDGYALVTDVEAILSQKPETDDDDDTLIDVNRISRDELRAQAAEMAAFTPNFMLFTIISTVVAAAGLLTDSAAVVVGSMVIAPLLGPTVGASVGSIVNDDELFREGVKAQFLGLVLAVTSATAFAVIAKLTLFPNIDIRALGEVAARVNPGALSLVIALGSGAAGALSLTAGASAPLVGVMIAAALIPPAAAVGLGIAYGDSVLVVSAGILVLVNILSINFASLAVLWLRGYRPDHWFEEDLVRRITLKRIAVLTMGILVLSSFLVVTSVDLQRNAKFESTVSTTAEESGLTVLSMDVEYQTKLFSRHPDQVVLRVATNNDRAADALRRRIKQRTNIDTSVVIIRENIETSTEARAQQRALSPTRGVLQ